MTSASYSTRSYNDDCSVNYSKNCILIRLLDYKNLDPHSSQAHRERDLRHKRVARIELNTVERKRKRIGIPPVLLFRLLVVSTADSPKSPYYK